MKTTFTSQLTDIVEHLSKIYPCGYIGIISVSEYTELQDLLLDNGYKLIIKNNDTPFPEYVRCVIGIGNWEICREVSDFCGTKIMVPTQFCEGLSSCDYLFFVNSFYDKGLKISLLRHQLTQFLLLEDFRLSNIYSFEKNNSIDIQLQLLKSELTLSTLSVKQKVELFFETEQLIRPLYPRQTALSYLGKSLCFDDEVGFCMAYYLLSMYFVFTNHKKFVIIPVDNAYQIQMGIKRRIHSQNYNVFKETIENADFSLTIDNLAVISSKFKRLNDYKKLDVDMPLNLQKIKILAEFSENCFLSQLIENGYF